MKKIILAPMSRKFNYEFTCLCICSEEHSYIVIFFSNCMFSQNKLFLNIGQIKLSESNIANTELVIFLCAHIHS